MMGLKISSKSVINLALRSLKFISIYFIVSWFLRLLRVWYWTDDQSDINQASWYKLIVKLKLWLVQAMWVCDCLCFWWNPPPQHQPPGGVYTHNILCIYQVYTRIYKYIPMIFHAYSWYIPDIYKGYTKYIHCILMVYTKDIPCCIYNEYVWYITGISNPISIMVSM